MFQDVSNVVLCAGAIVWRRSEKMRCIFHGSRSTLETSNVILRGRRNTLDVSCCVLSANRIFSAARSGDEVQIPWQGVAYCDMWWKSTEASQGKRRFWSCEVWNVRKSRAKSSFWCSNMSQCRRSVYEGSCKTFLVQGFKTGCNVVLRGRRGTRYIPTCVMTCQKWFCVAGAIVLLRSQKMRCIFCGKRSALGTSDVIFAWQARRIRRVLLPMFCESQCQGCATWWHSPLHTLHFTCHLYTPHFTLYTLHSTLYTPHFTLYTLHSTLYTPHSTLYTLHSTHYTLHFTPHSFHFTLHTLHSTLYTQPSTLYTLHSRHYTLHFTLSTPHLTLYTPHSSLPHFAPYTLHSKLYTLHSTLFTLHVKTLHFTLHILHSTLYTLHSTLYTPHFTLHTLPSILYTPQHSTLSTPYTLHFTLYTPHFTSHTLHSTLCIFYSTLYTLHSTLHTLHSLSLLRQLWFRGSLSYVWAFGFVGLSCF